MFFSKPDSVQHLMIGISEGKITIEEQTTGLKDTKPITLSDIKYDSPALLEAAKSQFHLKKGEHWATGYQFTLSIIDSKPVITVVGIDSENRFSKIYYDAKSGTVIDALHKTPSGGGVFRYTGSINKALIYKSGFAVNGISAGKNPLIAWGDSNPSEFISGIKPFVLITYNNGNSWEFLKIKENIKAAWFNKQDELFFATDKEVWDYSLYKREHRAILSLESSIKSVDVSLNKSIVISTEQYIYESKNDGGSWNKTVIPSPLLSLNIADDGKLVALTEERKLLIKKGTSWERIKTPAIEGEPKYIIPVEDSLIANLSGSLWSIDINKERWTRIPSEEPISRLIKKATKTFAISSSGNPYQIVKEGDSISWKMVKLLKPDSEIISDLLVKDDYLFIASIPDFLWTKLQGVKK
uniref:Exo-alpha-sialidase n=1 Tax=Cohnella candidum TaxID=2674991 RepID=A0A3G3JVZ7_9BACL|nr:hypothetical protein EAV92_07475 [Cohnella candidum]